MRLIDADALKDAVMETEPVFDTNLNPYQKTHDVMVVIDNAPTIEPKRGRWEVVDYEEPRRYGCSECKRLVWHTENYCPNCGAKMEASDD